MMVLFEVLRFITYRKFGPHGKPLHTKPKTISCNEITADFLLFWYRFRALRAMLQNLQQFALWNSIWSAAAAQVLVCVWAKLRRFMNPKSQSWAPKLFGKALLFIHKLLITMCCVTSESWSIAQCKAQNLDTVTAKQLTQWAMLFVILHW